MNNLDVIQDELFEVMGDVKQWCENEYNSKFSKYFEGVPDLYKNVRYQERKMSDDEVEWILTTLPLQLIAVSEELSQYKLNAECLKLYMKKKENEYVASSSQKTITAKREEASLKIMDYQLLFKAYNAVSCRVENEINFARELVMSAKKIWDSRKKVYQANPVSPTDLQDYSISK